jgi:hypothetical protein
MDTQVAPRRASPITFLIERGKDEGRRERNEEDEKNE